MKSPLWEQIGIIRSKNKILPVFINTNTKEIKVLENNRQLRKPLPEEEEKISDLVLELQVASKVSSLSDP